LFPKKAVLPGKVDEVASVAAAELWQIAVEPRTKDKPLLAS
jgi:hypothetical protein